MNAIIKSKLPKIFDATVHALCALSGPGSSTNFVLPFAHAKIIRHNFIRFRRSDFAIRATLCTWLWQWRLSDRVCLQIFFKSKPFITVVLAIFHIFRIFSMELHIFQMPLINFRRMASILFFSLSLAPPSLNSYVISVHRSWYFREGFYD